MKIKARGTKTIAIPKSDVKTWFSLSGKNAKSPQKGPGKNTSLSAADENKPGKGPINDSLIGKHPQPYEEGKGKREPLQENEKET